MASKSGNWASSHDSHRTRPRSLALETPFRRHFEAHPPYPGKTYQCSDPLTEKPLSRKSNIELSYPKTNRFPEHRKTETQKNWTFPGRRGTIRALGGASHIRRQGWMAGRDKLYGITLGKFEGNLPFPFFPGIRIFLKPKKYGGNSNRKERWLKRMEKESTPGKIRRQQVGGIKLPMLGLPT